MVQQTIQIQSGTLEQRMLSGQPFTYAMMRAEFNPLDRGSVIHRTIQTYRDRKLIAWIRKENLVIWTATPLGIAAASSVG